MITREIIDEMWLFCIGQLVKSLPRYIFYFTWKSFRSFD